MYARIDWLKYKKMALSWFGMRWNKILVIWWRAEVNLPLNGSRKETQNAQDRCKDWEKVEEIRTLLQGIAADIPAQEFSTIMSGCMQNPDLQITRLQINICIYIIYYVNSFLQVSDVCVSTANTQDSWGWVYHASVFDGSHYQNKFLLQP